MFSAMPRPVHCASVAVAQNVDTTATSTSSTTTLVGKPRPRPATASSPTPAVITSGVSKEYHVQSPNQGQKDQRQTCATEEAAGERQPRGCRGPSRPDRESRPIMAAVAAPSRSRSSAGTSRAWWAAHHVVASAESEGVDVDAEVGVLRSGGDIAEVEEQRAHECGGRDEAGRDRVPAIPARRQALLGHVTSSHLLGSVDSVVPADSGDTGGSDTSGSSTNADTPRGSRPRFSPGRTRADSRTPPFR